MEQVNKSDLISSRKGHFLDVRFPLGGLLVFYGTILLIYGFFTSQPTSTDSEWLYQKSLGININLIWGIFMLIVGGVLLLFPLVKRKA